VEFTELGIEGAFLFTPRLHGDDRGLFLEGFRNDVLERATGRSLHVAQVNTSVSAAGTLRGIHFAQVPPSQAKYVTCLSGSIFDVVVDLRIDSPTFGQWEGVTLDTEQRQALFLPEGLGHGFMALEDRTVVNYLCSTTYNPGREHGIHPLDPELAIVWPGVADGQREPLLSPKDAAAPSFREAQASGVLATYKQWQEHQGQLRTS
jgi:dTDP-4-dehydrorhamnose 3,5-epimerase